MASLPDDSRPNDYPPAGYPYQPRGLEHPRATYGAPRPPAPQRPAGQQQQRLSKPQALAVVRDLKRVVGVGSVLAFGAFAVLIAGKLSSANAANSSGTSNNVSSGGTFFGGDDGRQSNDDGGGFFNQQNNGGSFGTFGGGGFQSGPVTGSSVS